MTKFFNAVQTFTEKRLTYRKARKMAKQAKKPTFISELLGWLDALVFGVVVVLLINQFLFQLFVIPSPSMVETLNVKDRVFVSKAIYGIELYPYGPKILNSRKPDRDDIITFYNPTYKNKGSIASILSRALYMITFGLVNIEKNENGNPAEWLLVKRSAGKSGDTVTFENGEALIKASGTSNYIYEKIFREENGLSTAPHRSIPDSFYPNYSVYVRLKTLLEDLKISEKNIPSFSYLSNIYNNWIKTDETDYFDDYAYNKEYEMTKRSFDPSDMNTRSLWTKYNLGVYVPDGYILPLGDNRDNSYDGRYFGPVKTSNITGKLITFFWPLSRFGHTPS